MRTEAVLRGIPITTTLDGWAAAINGIETMRDMNRLEICSLQEYSRHAPRLTLRANPQTS